jgi:hypothetical protein
MDLASKFDTGAAKAAFKKKMALPSSSPERYKAETQSHNIKRSLSTREYGYKHESDNTLRKRVQRLNAQEAAAKAVKDAAEANRKYGTKNRTGPARKRTETERRLDKLEKEYKAGQFERDIERYK